MSWTNALWWLLYSMIAIVLQAMFPGVDFFLPGLLILLQEQKIWHILTLGVAFLLLQEGMGSMAFGGTLAWYASAVLLFYAGCRMFHGLNLLFVMLLSLILAVVHYMVFGALAALQDIPWDTARLFDECLLQALLTPWIWWGASWLRRRLFHEN
jgi:hypothetical protein